MNVKDMLFKPQCDESEWHPNFRNIYKEKFPHSRKVIMDWADGFKDRDNKFVKEFQTTFNSSFWELYLFAVFKKLGLEIELFYDRPDFIIGGVNGFIVEAVIANNAINNTPEWDKENLNKLIQDWSLDKIVDNATLRLANSFVSKSNKYLKSYKELEHVKGKPFVIAIAPFDSPFTNQQRMQAIHRVLYGFDRFVTIDWDENTRNILEAIYMESTNKSNGSKIPLGYFTRPDYSHISAVIFSNTATFSKVRILSDDPRVTLVGYSRYNDYGTQPIEGVKFKNDFKEDLLDGLIIFHNPYAKIPLIHNKLYNLKIAHSTFDTDLGVIKSFIPHGFLFQRFTYTFQEDDTIPSKEAVLSVKYILEK